MGFRVNTAGRVNQGHFAKVPANIAAPRSAFDRSRPHKTTIQEGYLYPILWQTILPGDTINMTLNALIRLATPIFPYMDNLYADIHAFFVPNRLLWIHWEQFQGAKDNPDDTTEYEVPSLDDATHAAGFSELSIYDYFGLPTKVTAIPQADMPIALPLRAYNKIVNDWYRDENLQDSLTLDTGDGPDTTNYQLFKRNRRKDYFTSCLPWPQKGPSVSLPLSGSLPVLGIGQDQLTGLWSAGSSGAMYESNGASRTYAHYTSTSFGAVSNHYFIEENPDHTGYPNLHVDLADGTSVSINELRESIVLQQMLELDARGGTRYVEILLARFGVVSPDFRLQRAEYIGGETFDINVNPIAQTAPTSGSNAQGQLAAFAVGRGKAAINHSFVEHGQLICMLSLRADTTYQQGMHRDWSVRSRYDYYEPLAANLGEQAVLNKEIYMQGVTLEDNAVFGYQERWAEQRYSPGIITGLFRSNVAASLDSWHLAVDFDELPGLS